MLTVEEFTQIASLDTEEEQRLLCGLHDISYETFSRLWPIEKLGRLALEHDIILLRVEHVFQANPAYFDPEDKGPRMSHSLIITYTTPISDTISLRSLNYGNPESKIEVSDWELTPSLREAIDKTLGARARL